MKSSKEKKPYVCHKLPFVCHGCNGNCPIIGLFIPNVGNRIFSSGFTLIELMITVVIIGILASIAVPSFQRFTETNRLASATNDLLSDMAFARSEAIKRQRGQVVICTSSSGSSCEGGTVGWKDGWIVFWDADSSNSYTTGSSGDILLKTHTSFPKTLGATVTPSGTAIAVYNRLGTAVPVSGSTIASIQINSTKVSGTRLLCFNTTGRLSLEYDKSTCS